MRFPSRNTLLILLGVASCRGREAPPPPQHQVHLQIGPPRATDFVAIAAVQNRLWVTARTGVVVIDPVAERWSAVYVDSEPLGPVEVIPCGSHVWLVGSDTVILADVETEQFEIRGATPGSVNPRTGRIEARCGGAALWVSDGRRLFHVPVSHDSTRQYAIPPFGDQTSFRDFVDALPGGVQFLIFDAYAANRSRLVHFDTATSRLETLDLPPGQGVYALEPADDGVQIRMYDQRSYLLKGRGQPWAEVPWAHDSAGRVLAAENGVVWVGASYDVSPSSYFVLRYIRDAAQPQDLLVLPDFFTNIRSRGSSVQYLGMLWIASGRNVMRIDPAAQEIASYRLNPDGTLAKSAFKFTREAGGPLRYFDGDSLRSLPGNEPVEPDSTEAAPPDSMPADLGEKPEGERFLDRDLLAVELQVLLRIGETQHTDELGFCPAVVSLGHEDLTQRKRGRHVLRKGVADELEGQNRARVVAPTG